MEQLFMNMPSAPLPLLSQVNPSWNLEQDEYEEDVHELPAPVHKKDKQIRRRSSKACDQCRKSKCKCERAGTRDEPCKNCVMLGTSCTFLGPSRKRGPPKGYIDAIESRLHQMEALLGALLSAPDARTRSLIEDLTGDSLAQEILARVDESPFGTQAKSVDAFEDRASRILRTSAPTLRAELGLPFASPSTEWQEQLKERLKAGASRAAVPAPAPVGAPAAATSQRALTLVTDVSPAAARAKHEFAHEGSPRQRRRLGSTSPAPRSPASDDTTDEEDESDNEALASAVGQLSMNEDSQVRYHGQVSGLHILGQSDRFDKRNEGGIWRFPKAGVWPRSAPPLHREPSPRDGPAWGPRMPSLAVQHELIDQFFSYVHPVLPLMHERQFREDFGHGGPVPPIQNTCGSQFTRRTDSHTPTAADPSDPAPAPLAPTNSASRVPTLLLLAMFAIAARYSSKPDAPLPSNEGVMWTAGDEYLEDAKTILNQTYASSCPSTCQALLLLGYRQIGIGAMAQAWLYVGMAVRMAQDIGLHRSADRWQRTGAQLFSETERQVRKRIWYACVIMDKYVSTYIGRPLSIFERDFDTPYPAEDHEEEMGLWKCHSSACPGEKLVETELPSSYIPVPMRLISCFNASARLSCILSNIVETIYAVHSPVAHSRHTESGLLEKRLDKWYVELPAHLGLSLPTAATSAPPPPPPHVLTLHMQYWCSVLLLHRPFIRKKSHQGTHGQHTTEWDSETNASCLKAFELCAMAATKISNIVVLYKENFCLKRSPAFLTYYVFSAGITHMTTLSVRPTDVQAGLGLQQCMDALQMMDTLWPSAGRAWELLHGAKIDMRAVEQARREAQRQRDKLDKRKWVEEEEEQGQGEEQGDGVAQEQVEVGVEGEEVGCRRTVLRMLERKPSDGSGGAVGAVGASGIVSGGHGSLSGGGAGRVTVEDLDSGMQRQPATTASRMVQQQRSHHPPHHQHQHQHQYQQRPPSQQQFPPQHSHHQYSLDLSSSGTVPPPPSTFNDFARWPPVATQQVTQAQDQEAFGYDPLGMSTAGDMSGLSTAPFVHAGGFVSSVGVGVGVGGVGPGAGVAGGGGGGGGNVWRDIPDQFADPSLITSSLYGLPVMQGQEATSSYLGDFAPIYGELPSQPPSSNNINI